ncbi:SIMPL domain-containing protein [Costertonia aggregata]|uniref:SIMPL domain-containing protein n=1 Tax=Costertonia aggregata TaxID=343403 RepID=A0A7H9AM09_9FLAO|nr:SIMPL domain-containing protein [Costertonia aggregata]QLG44414.1 SIMPL domain-containing protein [Costertonia aggregata]
MKKVVLGIALVLFSLGVSAQNYQNNITVNGTHKYTVTPQYMAKMIVSLNNVYYDAQTVTLSEIKSSYMDKLAKAGISSDRLKENKLQYALMGYEKEGTVFEFKTNSIEEMQTFLTTKSMGVSKSDSNMEAVLTDAQVAEYAKAAFDNAKAKAEAIAKKIGRKIGKAIYISDTNNKKVYESLYYGNVGTEKEYYVSVSFELL